MFWRKAKKIKNLKLDLQAAEIGTKAMERMRDNARAELKLAQDIIAVGKPANEKLASERNGLLAERDQLFKKVEELQVEVSKARAEAAEYHNNFEAEMTKPDSAL